MTDASVGPRGVPVERGKLITVVLPDDGTHAHRRIKKALREQKGVLRANSTACLEITAAALMNAKPGKLPEPALAHFVEVMVAEDRADEIFDLACELSNVGEQGGAVVFQQTAPICTPYALPEGVPEERPEAQDAV